MLAAALLLLPALARAAIDHSQTIPNRPLVLEDGDVDLYGELRTTLGEDVDGVRVGDELALPVGVDLGLGGMWEAGALFELVLRPRVETRWVLRTRLRPTEIGWFALGVWAEMPFGLMNDRLGARGLPLHFELPALRFERAIGAVQAMVRWDLGFMKDIGVTKGLGIEVAGVMRIDQLTFATLELDKEAPDFELLDRVFGFGVGLGRRVSDAMLLKLTARTDDLVDFRTWGIFVTLVNRWEDPRKSIIPR
jgi:hypothetical protein